MKADIALPCATQNELNGEDAQNLIKNDVLCVGEISNMGCTPEAIDLFIEHKTMYAPGKAVNAGGVATFRSGKMSQNAMHLSWSAAEVDEKTPCNHARGQFPNWPTKCWLNDKYGRNPTDTLIM